MPNRPPSPFSIGQRVRVVLNGEQTKRRLATIRDVVWHFQAERYDYYLEADGQRVAKRFSANDLEAAE